MFTSDCGGFTLSTIVYCSSADFFLSFRLTWYFSPQALSGNNTVVIALWGIFISSLTSHARSTRMYTHKLIHKYKHTCHSMTFILLCTFKHYSLLSFHVLSKLLLGTVYVPGTVLSVVDLKVNIPCFLPLSRAQSSG